VSALAAGFDGKNAGLPLSEQEFLLTLQAGRIFWPPLLAPQRRVDLQILRSSLIITGLFKQRLARCCVRYHFQIS
jgi:hypothetical protein